MKTNLITTIALSFCCVMTAFGQDATTLYNEGVKLKEEKNVREALAKFKQAASLKPDYYAAFYESGWCLNDLKDYREAINNLRKARVGWSTIPKVHFELGYAFEKLEKLDSAIYSYDRCLALKSDYSLAHKQLGYIAYNKEDYTAALDHFSRYEAAAKTEIKDYLYWYRKGFINNAIKKYGDAKTYLLKSKGYKADYINTYLELGFASSRLKENEQAISYYKQAIDLEPRNHIPYNGIGEVYRDNIKDRNEAMVWYQKALDVKPGERKAHFGMGYCLNSNGKYNEAITHLKEAIKSEATYAAAYVELGYSYYKVDRYTEALENLNKAILLNDKNENARYYATLVYIKQHNKTMAQKMVNELKALSSKQVAELQQKVDAM
ncbi:MAG: tetratricopeptide repeat protein [Chitinophagaceae bacterium]|nr:tetratricopeptide repeat protein [Chitinophagaceae bacterium]